MMNSRSLRRLNKADMHKLVWLSLCCLLWTCAVKASEMSAQQRRGQQIYLTGESPSGQPIQARLNNSGALLPATLMPCVNCHKYDGIGVTEGGITPADIRWFSLTKPYGITAQTGRPGEKIRPPYNQRNIKKAIAMGINAAGETLNQMMPRYQLNHQDMQDLIAYLTGLGNYQASGISDSQINIGVILPAANAPKAQAIKQVLNAWFADINKQGGIYQRSLQPVFIEPPTSHSEPALAQFKLSLKQSNVFAFVASHIEGIEALMSDFTQTFGIPVIGAFTATPLLEFPLNRHIFYLLSGQNKQVQALRDFVEQIDPKTKSAIVVENTADFKSLAQLLDKQHNNKTGLEIIEITSDITVNSLKSQLARAQQKQLDVIYLLVSQPIQKVFFDAAKTLNPTKPAELIGLAQALSSTSLTPKACSHADTLFLSCAIVRVLFKIHILSIYKSKGDIK
ncbi:MAG: ABC transporter substrate-binding protein [Algicola sp.]|nr:ABC transporter substrate-binding protein [Algicola sp.]